MVLPRGGMKGSPSWSDVIERMQSKTILLSLRSESREKDTARANQASEKEIWRKTKPIENYKEQTGQRLKRLTPI